MADATRFDLAAAVPWTARHALQQALKGKPSELLQSSSANQAAHACSQRSQRSHLVDPISKLKPEMLYRQVQYLVEEGDWAQQGEEVSLTLEGKP